MRIGIGAAGGTGATGARVDGDDAGTSQNVQLSSAAARPPAKSADASAGVYFCINKRPPGMTRAALNPSTLDTSGAREQYPKDGMRLRNRALIIEEHKPK
jgi:hypothetical protein